MRPDPETAAALRAEHSNLVAPLHKPFPDRDTTLLAEPPTVRNGFARYHADERSDRHLRDAMGRAAEIESRYVVREKTMRGRVRRRGHQQARPPLRRRPVRGPSPGPASAHPRPRRRRSRTTRPDDRSRVSRWPCARRRAARRPLARQSNCIARAEALSTRPTRPATVLR